MSSTLPAYPFGKIDQIAYVVRNLDDAVRSYWHAHQIGPWAIRTFDRANVRSLHYQGRPADFAIRVGFAMCGPIQVELIETLRGPSIHQTFLEQHGEGLHHVGVFVPNLADATVAMLARGYSLVQGGLGTGLDGDGGFAYFDTGGAIASIVELIELPVRRVAPAAFYPPQG